MNCPDCHSHLKEDAYKCMCGWRSKPKEPPKPKNCCNKCGDLRAYRCGPDDNPVFLCDTHREEFKRRLKEPARDPSEPNDDIAF